MNAQKTLGIEIIDDILKRPDALDSYLGEEVNNFLKEKLRDITEPTLIKMDLRKANPINYLFIKTGFGEFYKLVNSNTNLDCIYICNKSQLKHIFWGLSAYMDGNINRSE